MSAQDIPERRLTRFEEVSMIIGIAFTNWEALQAYVNKTLEVDDGNTIVDIKNYKHSSAQKLFLDISKLMQAAMDNSIRLKELLCDFDDAVEDFKSHVKSVFGVEEAEFSMADSVITEVVEVINLLQQNDREGLRLYMTRYRLKENILTGEKYSPERVIEVHGDTDRPAFFNSSLENLPSQPIPIPPITTDFSGSLVVPELSDKPSSTAKEALHIPISENNLLDSKLQSMNKEMIEVNGATDPNLSIDLTLSQSSCDSEASHISVCSTATAADWAAVSEGIDFHSELFSIEEGDLAAIGSINDEFDLIIESDSVGKKPGKVMECVELSSDSEESESHIVVPPKKRRIQEIITISSDEDDSNNQP